MISQTHHSDNESTLIDINTADIVESTSNISDMIRLTNKQLGSIQIGSISFTLYPQNYEEIYRKKIDNLSKLVEFVPLKEVSLFLRNNTFLIDIINEAIIKLKDIFKEEKLKLSIEYDPEIEMSTVLSLKIITKKSPVKTIELLNTFNELWWFEHKQKSKQKLIIEEEYE